MRKLTFLLFLTLLLSCHKKEKNSDYALIAGYENYEKLIYLNPQAVLDSLNGRYNSLSNRRDSLSKSPISSKSEALTILLHTIAYEQNNGYLKNDTLLTDAHNWFIKYNDNYNICRSSLY